MKKSVGIELPDKIFGLDSGLIVIFIKPIGLFLLLMMMFNLVVFPRIEEIQANNDKIKLAEDKEKTYRQKINYLRSIDQETLQRDEGLVSSALLPEKNAYFLVNVVRKIADKYGYMVDSFSVKLGDLETITTEANATGKGFSAIPVSLVLVGPSTNYLDLVAGLERSLPVLKLDDFEMKNITGVSTIQLGVNGFYISEKKMVESDKLSLADLTLNETESVLVSKLDEYEVLENISLIGGVITNQKEFVNYDRSDPFSQ